MNIYKYIKLSNYFRYIKNRIVEIRLKYGAPIEVDSISMGERVKFIVSSNKEYFLRAQLSYTRTMNWIDKHIKYGDVVYDIGANVGAYSLLIGKRVGKDGSVFAFEPESSNYYSLNRNIIANSLSKTVIGLCVALDKDIGYDNFYLSSAESGSATHSVSTPSAEGVSFQPVHVQGIITMSLDQFIEMNPNSFPNHIKIDVDGNELNIIKNSNKTLSDSRLKTIMIEVSENVSNGVVEYAIESKGFVESGVEYSRSEVHGIIKNICFVRV